MKIGKTIKTVTSPKREVRKAAPAEKPIPVEMPVKVPEKAEMEFRLMWGRGMMKSSLTSSYLYSITS